MFCTIPVNVFLCKVLYQVEGQAGPVQLVQLAILDGQVGRNFVVVCTMSIVHSWGSAKAGTLPYSLLIFRTFVTVEDTRRIYVQ